MKLNYELLREGSFASKIVRIGSRVSCLVALVGALVNFSPPSYNSGYYAKSDLIIKDLNKDEKEDYLLVHGRDGRDAFIQQQDGSYLLVQDWGRIETRK